jgi:hypothetical protein
VECRGDPAGPDALSRALAAAVPGTGVHVQPAATAEGGAMPPGPLQAFLREREATAASFAAVTVTEYSEVCVCVCVCACVRAPTLYACV